MKYFNSHVFLKVNTYLSYIFDIFTKSCLHFAQYFKLKHK